MATSEAKLIIRMEADSKRLQKELDSTKRKLGRFESSAKKNVRGVRKSFDKNFSAMKKTLVAFAGLATAIAGMRKLVTVARQFDVINASLITATGSAENAKIAFGAIEEFAATTPFQLNEVADAFIKMTNLGLDPSAAALRSYGNTASAMGKSLNQMIEAVADAATGEFERLKEFGIKSSAQGDKVKFTFRGVTKEVEKSAAAISGYLRDLGDIEFAGAMEERTKTLDGALSNLEDSWDGLFRKIGQSGASEQITSDVRELSAILNDQATINAAKNLASALIVGFSGASRSVVDFINAITSLNGIDADASLGEIDAMINRIDRTISGELSRLQLFGPNGWVEYYNDLELASALVELRAARDKLLSEGDAGTGDVLGQFGVGAKLKPREEAPKVDNNILDAVIRRQQSELEAVTAGLRTQEEAIRVSYARRREIIISNTQGNIALRNDLLARLSADTNAALNKEFEDLKMALRTEEEVLMDSYNRRHDIIISNTQATEEEKKALIVRLNDETLQEVVVSVKRIKKDIPKTETQAEAFDRIFGAGALTSLFSDLDNIEDRFKSLLANIAAQALASGISSMFSGGGGTFGGGVSSFFGGLFGGAKADGGPVSAGKIHLVGERGPEMFVPNVGGSIVPNDKLGGNTSVVINLPNIKDTDTFRKSKGQIAAEYRSEFLRAGRNA